MFPSHDVSQSRCFLVTMFPSHDTVAPMIVSVSVDSSVTFNSTTTATLTITLSEETSNLSLGSIYIEGGQALSMTGSGLVRYIDVVAEGNRTTPLVVSVGLGQFSDAAGNPNSNFVTTLLSTVDTVAPTITSAVASLSSGSVLSTRNYASVTFSVSEDSRHFTKEDVTVYYGSVQELRKEGTSYVAQIVAAENSTNAITVSVAGGAFEDLVGNASSGFSYVLPLQVDTVLPSGIISNVSMSVDSGLSDHDHITNVTAQTIRGEVSQYGVGDKVWLSVNGVDWVVTDILADTYVDENDPMANSTTSYYFETQVSLVEGSHTLRVKVVDAVGNFGTEQSLNYILDTSASGVVVRDISFDDDTGMSSTDFITKTQHQTIRGNVSGGLTVDEILS